MPALSHLDILLRKLRRIKQRASTKLQTHSAADLIKLVRESPPKPIIEDLWDERDIKLIHAPEESFSLDNARHPKVVAVEKSMDKVRKEQNGYLFFNPPTESA